MLIQDKVFNLLEALNNGKIQELNKNIILKVVHTKKIKESQFQNSLTYHIKVINKNHPKK